MADVELVIKIPEEFVKDWNDTRFADCIKRVRCDLNSYQRINGNYGMAGIYEMETLDMLQEALHIGTPLPEGYGRLIDADALVKKMEERQEELKDDKSIWETACVETALDMFAPTIIEADKENEE